VIQKIPLTRGGADFLAEELKRLKGVERPRVVAAIAEARSHGDLKENAEYHAAREEQGFIEGRIQEIEGTLANSQVIDVAQLPRTGKVVFGVTVTLLDLGTESEVRYQIVGDLEADIAKGKIAVSSPIARALIGKEEGDEATVQAPGGNRQYEILAVAYL